MDKPTIHLRWLVSAALAGVASTTALLLSRSSLAGTATEHEVLTGLAWMAAIVAVVCVVRSGFDAGVHHTAKQRVKSR